MKMGLALSVFVLSACAAADPPSTPSTDHAPGAQIVEDSYDVPPRLDDGWQVASAEDLGLDRAPLAELTEVLRSGDEYPNVHGLLIVKDGRLVYEQYFAGEDRRYGPDGQRHTVEVEFDRDTLHDLRSATKSVTSALVGIALASDVFPSLDTPLCEVFPSHAAACAADKRMITLRHALTMTAGLDWNETEVPYSEPSNDEIQIYYHVADTVGYLLAKPLVAEPGAEWDYNSALPMLLGFALSRTTEVPLREFARRRLFEPLGIRKWEWRGPPMFEGDPTPAGNLWLRPRDLAKIGALYLGGGEWNGRQVLPARWVEDSTKPQVSKEPTMDEYGNLAVGEHAYGYLWHHDRYLFADGVEVEVWKASGNGGQRIWLVPELQLLVVHLTGRYDQPGAQWQAERVLLERVVPWARGEAHSRPRLLAGRPFLAIGPGGWKEVELTPRERARYVGSYDQQGERVEVWEEDGLLKITPAPGDEQREIHLIPKGNHVFAQGRYEDGRLVRIYWPDARIVFAVTDGRAWQWEVRRLDEGAVLGTAHRIP